MFVWLAAKVPVYAQYLVLPILLTPFTTVAVATSILLDSLLRRCRGWIGRVQVKTNTR
jgi:hypothetical protein